MSDNFLGAVGGLVKSVGTAAAQAGGAAAGAASTYVNEWTDDVEAIGDGFEEGGIAGGGLATLDAVSLGNIWQNEATAYGLIKNDDRSEALFKGVVNGLSLNPIALKNFLDAGQAVEPPSSRCARPVGGFSIQDLGAGFGRSKTVDQGCFPWRPVVGEQPRGGGTSSGCGGTPVTGRPVKGTSLADILNDKSLCFEDMLALAMICIVGQQQKEIEAKLKEIQAMDDALAAKEASAKSGATAGCAGTPDVLGIAEKLFRGELDVSALGDVAQLLKPALPMLLPIICPALAAIPPVGTVLAVAAPIVLPMVLDMAAGAAKQAAAKQATAGGAAGGASSSEPAAEGQESDESIRNSRSLQFEKLKMLTTRMSEMQQTLSNVLNTQHETSMAAIRSIRA